MKLKTIFLALVTTLIFVSCVEVFDIKNLGYENFLVVEATITNEFKKHQVKLSRTFEIDSLGPNNELNANVFILDDTQSIYTFNEIGEGIYESENSFAAETSKTYTLKIETSTGEKYTSDAQQLTPITQVDEIKANLETNPLEEEIITVSVSSYNPRNDANYYRYEYEETYKIVAPYYTNRAYEIISENPPRVDVIPRNEDLKNCYKTLYSNKIIQTETKSLSEDAIINFPIREISINDFIISHRYSILIKQYVQNATAYEYYNLLSSFSSNDSYFNQIQAGYFAGNINAEANSEEKVIGFFEVSSVSEKRFFFNREEHTILIPNYVDSCFFIAPRLTDLSGSPLIMALKNGYIFYDNNDFTIEGVDTGPYILVKKVCGDCTELGTNIKPDFWID